MEVNVTSGMLPLTFIESWHKMMTLCDGWAGCYIQLLNFSLQLVFPWFCATLCSVLWGFGIDIYAPLFTQKLPCAPFPLCSLIIQDLDSGNLGILLLSDSLCLSLSLSLYFTLAPLCSIQLVSTEWPILFKVVERVFALFMFFYLAERSALKYYLAVCTVQQKECHLNPHKFWFCLLI